MLCKWIHFPVGSVYITNRTHCFNATIYGWKVSFVGLVFQYSNVSFMSNVGITFDPVLFAVVTMSGTGLEQDPSMGIWIQVENVEF